MATTATVSYSAEMLEQQEATTEGRLVPPPSCWFTDVGLDAAAPSSSSDEEEEEHALIPVDDDNCESADDGHASTRDDNGYYYEEHKSSVPELGHAEPPPPQQQTATTPQPQQQQQQPATTPSLPQVHNHHHSHQQLSQPPRNSSPDHRLMQRPHPSLHHHHHHRHRLNQVAVAGPSPSWSEISSQVLPSAARELLSSSLRRICHTARLGYAKGRWHRKYSDIGNNSGGYFRNSSALLHPTGCCLDIALGGVVGRLDEGSIVELPPFSSLPWIDRQLVQEWRTYLPEENAASTSGSSENGDNSNIRDDKISQDTNREKNNSSPELSDVEEDDDFDRARTLVPQPMARPKWHHADVCFDCRKPFGPTRLRHHCRLCGHSVCQIHSAGTHKLPHLGYDPDVPERVCDGCKRRLWEQNLAERVAWRLARCRDYTAGQLSPYFDTGIDTVEQAALRIAQAALATARSIPLGAQATVAVETVEVLRKHGLNGIYGIMLRKEFLAAADLLRKALGINKTAWPLSVHELSAAIFYALAQHRAMRGINPDREEMIHSIITTTTEQLEEKNTDTSTRSFRSPLEIVVDETDEYIPEIDLLTHLTDLERGDQHGSCKVSSNASCASSETEEGLPFTPVCTAVEDSVMASLIFYAPIALNFIYATKEVDMQLLAAQQGWRLLYAYLDPETDREGGHLTDKPTTAMFVHEQKKIVALAIRGTATIHDVITDIRQEPVTFPEMDDPADTSGTATVNGFARDDRGWTNIETGKGLAVCGMATAAVNLFREHIDVLIHLVRQGYRIRITGHSLGGAIASLVAVLVLKELEEISAKEAGVLNGLAITDVLRVYAYGSPSCVDADLAEFTEPFVFTAVQHDDVVPRLTPTSCRGLLKHLLHIRETWVKAHLTDDLMAFGERARLAWAPRWRSGFTLTSAPKYTLKASSRSLKRYAKKKIQSGKRHLLAVTEKLMRESSTVSNGSSSSEQQPTSEMVQKLPPAQSVSNLLKEADPEPEQIDSSEEASSNMNDLTSDETPDNAEPALLVDFMGGVDNRTETLVIDGDEFFDIDEMLIESEEDNSTMAETFVDAWDEAKCYENQKSCSLNTEEPNKTTEEKPPNAGDPVSSLGAPDETAQSQIPEGTSSTEPDSAEDDGPGAVVLEETPLPRMFIPGKIIHIYSHRGVYKAAYVPRAFRELRRISLAGNMLTDHKTKTYYEALLEVMSVRNAQEGPPRWTAFDEDDTCSCCASRFTWASTCDSKAQEARDKHNCRSCGTLVCDPCSSNRMPLASIGVTVPVRTCDRCYNDIGGVLTGLSMTSSFAEGEKSQEKDDNSVARPERQRERRSVVVDDLAKRIKKSAFIK